MTRRSFKGIGAGILALLVVGVAAWAFWSAGGSGTASAAAGSLSAASVSASGGSQAGSVTLTIGTQALLNGASNSSITYTVYRSANGTTFAPVPSTSGCYGISYGTTSCIDSGLTGSFSYYVLAHFGGSSAGGWTAQSAVAGPVSVTSDATAPVTTATASPTPNADGWNNTSPVTVTLSADDNGGSGVKEIRYTTDGSAPSSSSTRYTAPFNVSGTTTVKYFATDNAGNAETAKSLAVKIDTAAPTGGALTANGSTSMSFNTTGVVSLTKVNFTDSNSGLAAGSNAITRASASLSGNVCGSFSGSAAVTVDVSGNDSTTLATGCYRYTLSASDVAGNTATPVTSAIVKVDRSAPSTPTLAFSGLSANAFYDSATSRVYIRPAAGGTFTVTAASTDADTGVTSYAFSNPGATFGATQTGDHVAYTFGATATAPSTAQTVTATNAAGSASSSATYNIVADTTAPSSGAITANGSTSDSFNNTGSVSLTKTDFTDSGSGLASSANGISRQSTTLSNGACGTTWSAATAVTVTNGKDAATLTNGCYRYLLDASDNVGNVATTAVSAQVKVDTTAPTGTLTAPTAGTYGGNVNLAATAADSGGSGLATVTFQQAPSGSTTYTDIATDASAPYTGTWDTTNVANGVYNVRAVITDAAGNSTPTATVAVTVNNSFTVSVANASKLVAGTATTVTLTAVANTTTNTAYSGTHTVTFSDPSTAPDGTRPSYPATALAFTNGVASASVTLVKAETTTLTATSGGMTGTSSSLTVSDTGTPAGLTFTNTAPLTCATVFSCSVTIATRASYSSLLTVTDAYGNVGPKVTGNTTINVTVAHTNTASTLTGASLQITKNTGTPSGTQTGGPFQLTAGSGASGTTDTVTASAPTWRSATLAVSVP